jgi:Putative beta-barrel porin-2, OmpL-like. bbp2
MRSLGLRNFVILTSWVVLLANPLPIPAFAGSEQDLQTKTPIPGQVEAQATSASSLVLQPASVAVTTLSTLASNPPEQAAEMLVDNDSPNDGTPENNDEPKRRALPAPLDSIFPSSDYLGPTPLIGAPDTDPIYPLTKALWSAFPALKKARIKVYGWANFGVNASTSGKSNIPESYATVPNQIELDQGVLRIERVPDTVQTDHVDWGFRLSSMYGMDYRWTTSQGWFSGQLLHHNYLYGFDPVEAYGLFYVPSVAKGMVIKIGRYISPPDIEARLAPDNYLYTHSLMFTYDCYTQTGINAAIKLNDQWSILFGIHAGDDIAPWNGAAHPTAMAMARWVSASNNDSLYGGIDSLNGGSFKAGHDNLQQFNLTWTHRFNTRETFLTSTETYYLFQTHALVGGTVNNGPPHTWFTNVGVGAPIPGKCSCLRSGELHRVEVVEEEFSFPTSCRLHRRFQRRAVRLCNHHGKLDGWSDAPI